MESKELDKEEKLVDIMPKESKKMLYSGMGFVELIDVKPRLVPEGRTADMVIAENARVSTQKGRKTQADDEKLVKRLMKDNHTSPI